MSRPSKSPLKGDFEGDSASLPLRESGERVFSDSLIANIMRSEGVTFSHNNSVTLLTNGAEKFKDMFAAIHQARSSKEPVCLQGRGMIMESLPQNKSRQPKQRH